MQVVISADSEPAPSEGYACPYCAARAPADHWFTKAQAEFAAKAAGTEVLGSVFDEFRGQDSR